MITPASIVATMNEYLREKAPELAKIIDGLTLVEATSYEAVDDDGGESKTYPITTVSVTQKNELLVNPDFVTGSDETLLVFALGVLALMEVNNTMGRRGERDHARWGMAANVLAAETLVGLGLTPPPNVLRADNYDIVNVENLTTEEVYDLIVADDLERIKQAMREGLEAP